METLERSFSNGLDLAFEVRGRGEPLLLLHGFTGTRHDWEHAGRDRLEAAGFELIVPDARGHGRSTNPDRTLTHRQCALDMLALLDHLGVERCAAIGMSMGGNVLLHMATLAPERLTAMVLVSATMYFPSEARALMRAQLPAAQQPAGAWQAMRLRHTRGDAQIEALWETQRAFADSVDDVCFTPPELARIRARTLIVYGDRDPLYPVEMGVALYRAIPQSVLWVVPRGGHGPIFLEAAPAFAETAVAFLRAPAEERVGP